MKGEKGKEYVREMKKNKKKREIKASWGEREKNEEGGNGDKQDRYQGRFIKPNPHGHCFSHKHKCLR